MHVVPDICGLKFGGRDGPCSVLGWIFRRRNFERHTLVTTTPMNLTVYHRAILLHAMVTKQRMQDTNIMSPRELGMLATHMCLSVNDVGRAMTVLRHDNTFWEALTRVDSSYVCWPNSS